MRQGSIGQDTAEWGGDLTKQDHSAQARIEQDMKGQDKTWVGQHTMY